MGISGSISARILIRRLGFATKQGNLRTHSREMNSAGPTRDNYVPGNIARQARRLNYDRSDQRDCSEICLSTGGTSSPSPCDKLLWQIAPCKPLTASNCDSLHKCLSKFELVKSHAEPPAIGRGTGYGGLRGITKTPVQSISHVIR